MPGSISRTRLRHVEQPLGQANAAGRPYAAPVKAESVASVRSMLLTRAELMPLRPFAPGCEHRGLESVDGHADQIASTLLVRVLIAPIWVVAANINPLPAVVGLDQTPAVIPVIIEVRASKAEGEEIAVVEPVVPVVAEALIERKVIAIEGTPVEPLNTSADHRRCDHPAPTHRGDHTASTRGAHTASTHRRAHTASMHSGYTAAPMTTAVATAGHSG
jgi:hypothetical protein